jgi:phosphoadenosine phosphosulfate reductase
MNAIEMNAKASPDFAEKLEQTIHLLQGVELEYAPLTQASSLGAEDMVVTHLIHETGIESDIFVLDTGMLHPETLALIERLERRYQRRVDVFHPKQEVADAFVETFGKDAMYQSVALRKHCCDIRKTEPLAYALEGKKAWLTGLRREQSAARSDVVAIEHQSERVKVNPLARWTWGDVWHYIALHKIPYNPLHDQFFPSIGCAPCTRAVTLGEDPRSGRWWWEQESAKECGLHVASSLPGESSSLHSSIIPIKEIAA